MRAIYIICRWFLLHWHWHLHTPNTHPINAHHLFEAKTIKLQYSKRVRVSHIVSVYSPTPLFTQHAWLLTCSLFVIRCQAIIIITACVATVQATYHCRFRYQFINEALFPLISPTRRPTTMLSENAKR